MLNLTGEGLRITIMNTQTFPFGFSLEHFSDDVDPILVEPAELVGFEMLLDGTLFDYQKASPTLITLSIIPGTEDDTNLRQLLMAKNGGTSLIPLPDATVMTIAYGDGGTTIYSNGTIISGPFSPSVATNGRTKGNLFKFAFGSVTPLNNATDVLGNVLSTVGRFL